MIAAIATQWFNDADYGRGDEATEVPCIRLL